MGHGIGLEWFIEPFYHEEGECYEDWFSDDLTLGSPRNFITFSKPDHYADAFSWNLSHSRDGEFEIVNFSYSVYEPYAPNFPAFLFRQTLEMFRDCNSDQLDDCLKCIQCLDYFSPPYGKLAKRIFKPISILNESANLQV